MTDTMRGSRRGAKWLHRLGLGLVVGASLSCENLDRYGPDSANAPAAPAGLIAVPMSSTEISLLWSATPSAGTVTYRVFRGGAAVGTTQTAGFADNGLTASTTYTYTVVVIDVFGSTSPPSNPASATTLAEGQTDDSPPTTPTNLTAVAGSSSTISLQWSASTDDVGVLGYRIYRGGVEIALASGTEYTDQGLTASTAYTYSVAAFDGAAHLSAQSAPAQATTLGTGVVDAQAPTAPQDLNAVPASSSSISLTWTASTDDIGVLGYRVYRAGVEIAVVAGTDFVDTGLAASTLYSYTVAAYDASGHLSAPSAPASATTLAAGQSDTDAPSTPAPVLAIPSGPNGITVSWGPATDNVGVLGYRIFRDGVEVATAAALLYADPGLTPATTYSYTVTAYDAAGNESAPSAAVSATTLGAGVTDTDPPSVPTGLTGLATAVSITLNWNASTDNVGVTGYIVYRDGIQIGTTVVPSFVDLGLCPAEGFSYAVAARDAANNLSAQSAAAVVTTLNASVTLGSAGSFGALAGAGLSLTTLLPSVVNGDAGSSPGTSLLGLPLLSIVGGTLHVGDAAAASAQVDLASAMSSIGALPVCAGNDLTGQALGGLTLGAGVYIYTAGTSLGGTLTLDAGGDPNAVFIITVSGNLSTVAASNTVLAGGAQAQNVYWVVAGTVSVGTNATLRGNVLATSDITVASDATVVGRVLSRTGTISLAHATVGL